MNLAVRLLLVCAFVYRRSAVTQCSISILRSALTCSGIVRVPFMYRRSARSSYPVSAATCLGLMRSKSSATTTGSALSWRPTARGEISRRINRLEYIWGRSGSGPVIGQCTTAPRPCRLQARRYGAGEFCVSCSRARIAKTEDHSGNNSKLLIYICYLMLIYILFFGELTLRPGVSC